MESIKDKVAIIGMGCVKFGENWGKSIDDMIVRQPTKLMRMPGSIQKIYRPPGGEQFGPDIPGKSWPPLLNSDTSRLPM
jgi:hypothetical protein